MAPHQHQHLRTQSAPGHRALDHPHESIFDAPHADEAASRDTAAHHTFQEHQRPLKAPQLQQQQQQQPQSDSADWDTRSTILLAEAIAVTAIVGTILYFCVRKHKRRLTQQRVFTAAQMQEWATIRMSPTGEAGAAMYPVVVPPPSRGGRRTRVDSNVSGMSLVSVGRDGRIRVDSGLGGMSLGEVSARLSRANSNQEVTPNNNDNNNNEETAEDNRTPAQRVRDAVLFVPRTIGSALMYPLRALEDGVNNWATANEDEIFLRQFIERLEAEREAAMESPEQREARLKEAFMKECMIWKLDEENFMPPKPILAFGGDDGGDITKTLKQASDSYREDHDELDYDQFLGYIEGGNFTAKSEAGLVQDDQIEADEEGAGNADFEDTEGVKIEKEAVDDIPDEVCEGKSDGAHQAVIEENAAAANDCENNLAVTDFAGESSPKNGDLADEDSVVEEPASLVPDEAPLHEDAVVEEPSPLMMDENRDPGVSNLEQPPAATSAAEDTFDTESTPGYLYLSSSSRSNRRRANTGSSSISSANRSTLSSVESIESFASEPAPSAEPHKIPNECAICLCDYEPGDVVVASSHGECPHAFHQECIVEWLVKMQEGTPCPCCRRTFVELDEHIPTAARGGNTSTQNNNSGNSTNDTAQDPEEAERQRQERRRRSIELGIQGGRAFNTSVITTRRSSSGSSSTAARTPEEVERQRQERQERLRRHMELGARRGRAFNTSVISMR